MSSLGILLALVSSFGVGGLVVFYFLSDPSRILKIWSILARAVYLATRKWKLAAISSRLEAHINASVNQLAGEAPSAFPNSFRIQWIHDAEENALLKDGTVVVRLRDQMDHGKPLATATMLFLEAGVIPQSRPYVERRVLRAVDLALAYRILENSPYPSSVNHLTSAYLEPALEDPRTGSFYQIADLVDRAGLLTRVVLREMSGLAARLTGIRPSAAIRTETSNFFHFTGRVIGRTSQVPLAFFGRYIRCTVALIANPEVYATAGLALYRRNFKRDIDSGIHTIYLLARGVRNLGVARSLAKWATEQSLVSGTLPDKYTQADASGSPIPAECIVCFSAHVGRTVQTSPLEDALIAISQVIPETLTGDVEVMSLAREPGILTKVLVASDRHADPIPLCLGPKRARLKAIQSALQSEETIDFVHWSPDQKANLVAALVPLNPDDVASIWIAPDSLSAQVYVRSPEAAHRAVGSDGVNLKVAQSLLNIHIDLETRDAAVAPEEELLEVLRYRVPEIEDGSITVANVARRLGRASKVAVSSSTIADPVRTCVGPGANTAKAIERDLMGEHVTFLQWRPDSMVDMVRQALRPLPEKDILNVEIDSAGERATVIVRAGKAVALAIGKEGDNVRLAERVTGLHIAVKGDHT